MSATWRIFADWEPVTGMEHAGTNAAVRRLVADAKRSRPRGRNALALGGEHASPLEGTATAARWLEASMGAGDADAYWPALLRRLETCCVAEEESP